MTVREGEILDSSTAQEKMRDEDWIKLVREFEDELVKRLGGRLRRVVARSSPDDLVYESNVFVFVDSVDMDVMREVAKAALEVQKRLGMEGLSPMTVREGEIELRKG
jgi:Fe-S oxidoreductase